MTIEEALGVATEACEKLGEGGSVASANHSVDREAAAALRRWQPFIEAAIALGGWWVEDENDPIDTPAAGEFARSYRAAVAEEER